MPQSDSDSPRRVCRPKLGVVAGEVTLLPRHWEWLKSQSGGASVTMRKLIDEARHVREKQNKVREAQETTYRFMTVMAGNFYQYEEALLGGVFTWDVLRLIGTPENVIATSVHYARILFWVLPLEE